MSISINNLNCGLPCTLLIAIVVIAVALIRFFPTIRTMSEMSAKNKELLASGEKADATVLSIQKTGTMINSLHEVNLVIDVHPANRSSFQTTLTVPMLNMQIA